VAAGVAAVVVWVVGEPLLGHDLVVKQSGQDPQDLGVAAMVIFSVLPALLGWAFLAGLERVTSRASLIWTVVALVVLLVSFAPLFGVEASGGSKVVLALIHVAVGAVLIPGFLRTAKVREQASAHIGTVR
jgi:hypothetical protein